MTLAAVLAVLIWSLKPVFIEIASRRALFGEIYVLSASISILVSTAVIAVSNRRLMRLLRGADLGACLRNGVLAGICLGFWYYGFYRGLVTGNQIDVTVISFTWPLIAVLVSPILAPSITKRLEAREMVFVLLAFAGAATIAIGKFGLSGFDISNGIWLACIASLGSGIYVPFALLAIKAAERSVGSKLWAAFFVFTIANIAALLVNLALYQVSDVHLKFYGIDSTLIAICVVIGVGSLLISEIAWNWALLEYRSLTLSSIIYFSPALSAVFLLLFFDVQLSPYTALGLMVILFSNLALHGKSRNANAVLFSLTSTVFVALAGLLVDPIWTDFSDTGLFAISGIFAILSSFLLGRVSERLKEEALVREEFLVLLAEVPDRDTAREVAKLSVELEFLPRGDARELELESRVDNLLETVGIDDRRMELRRNFYLLRSLNRSALAPSERIALWVTGLGCIVILLLSRSDDWIGLFTLYVFSGGSFLLLFTVADYERNYLMGLSQRFNELVRHFQRLGAPPFVPWNVHRMGIYRREHDGLTIRRGTEDGGEVEEVIHHETSAFRMVFAGVSVVLAASTLVVSYSVERTGQPLVGTDWGDFSDNSEFPARDLSEREILVSYQDWPTSRIIAEILAARLGALDDVRTTLVRLDLLDAMNALVTDDNVVIPDFWAGNHSEYVDAFEGTEMGLSPEGYGASHGVYYLGLERDEPVSVTDLASAAFAAQFDTDGDGLGEIWIGDRSWKSTYQLQTAFEENPGLVHWEVEIYSEEIFLKKLELYRARDLPLMFYSYRPHWLHSKYAPPQVQRSATDSSPGISALCVSGYCPGSLAVRIAFSSKIATVAGAIDALSSLALGVAEIEAWLLDLHEGRITIDDIVATALAE